MKVFADLRTLRSFQLAKSRLLDDTPPRQDILIAVTDGLKGMLDAPSAT